MRTKNKIKGLCLGLIVFGALILVHSLQTPLKAYASKILIDKAWQETKRLQKPVKPWPWMDSFPIAKITLPKLGQSYVVLSGVSGAVMAFAPGWHEGTSKPGENGISMISAHKDTHFADLKDIQKNDVISIEIASGERINYKVKQVSVLEKPSLRISSSDEKRTLILSTCYPFSNWQIGGDMRFVIVAEEFTPEIQEIAALASEI